MELYVFTLTQFRQNPELEMRSYEVEEKAKSYVNNSCHRRFLKSEIGVPTGYSNNEVILLENNPAKAAQILIPVHKNKLESVMESVERLKTEISVLETLSGNAEG